MKNGLVDEDGGSPLQGGVKSSPKKVRTKIERSADASRDGHVPSLPPDEAMCKSGAGDRPTEHSVVVASLCGDGVMLYWGAPALKPE